MQIISTNLVGISSIFTTTPNRKHLKFTTSTGFFGSNNYWTSNEHYDPVFRTGGHRQHGASDMWLGWCENHGQIAGQITLLGGTSVDYGLLYENYASLSYAAASITLIDITCIMSYHAGGPNTVASQVYGFRQYNRVIWNSAGTPAVARNVYYGAGSGSASLDTDNLTIVVVSNEPYLRFTPASSNTATVTNITYFGHVVQSY